jgi:hypothetical protein
VSKPTIQRKPTPTAILVGLAEDFALVCTEALGAGGMRVLRAAHAAAAAERIPVVMPQIVLIPEGMAPGERDLLNDGCVAVGADVLELSPKMAPEEVTYLLRKAANAALTRALRGS